MGEDSFEQATEERKQRMYLLEGANRLDSANAGRNREQKEAEVEAGSWVQ